MIGAETLQAATTVMRRLLPHVRKKEGILRAPESLRGVRPNAIHHNAFQAALAQIRREEGKNYNPITNRNAQHFAKAGPYLEEKLGDLAVKLVDAGVEVSAAELIAAFFFPLFLRPFSTHKYLRYDNPI